MKQILKRLLITVSKTADIMVNDAAEFSLDEQDVGLLSELLNPFEFFIIKHTASFSILVNISDLFLMKAW
jgi:hypothetical protein